MAGTTKVFEIYWGDLTQEAQGRLWDFLGGENGNYDYFPLATLEIEAEDNTETRCADCAYLIEDDDGRWICDDCGRDIHDIPDDECSCEQGW